MKFIIFLEFFWIYLNFISIFKYLIQFKNAKKFWANLACARGIATWTGTNAYVARRWLVALTWHTSIYYIYSYNMFRSPVYREINYQCSLTVVYYIVKLFFHFFRVGLKSIFSLIFRTRGIVLCVGSNRDKRDDVNAVDTKSTASTIKHVP